MNVLNFDTKLPRLLSRSAILGLAIAVTLSVSGCRLAPRPIDINARRAVLPQERAELTRGQEAPSAPVTMDEAVSRALKYNLDYRIKLMEEALADGTYEAARMDLLPRMTAAAGYSERNNDNASSSRSVITGRQSLEPSISSERDRLSSDLGMSWNVLDFGVSYFQARQQSDRTLVAEERRRRAIHLVNQQVRLAWWQAASAQELEPRVAPLLAQARAALEDSRQIETERLQAPLEALTYQRQLLDIVRQLEAINEELAQAKPRLAALMSLEPGTQYQLAAPGPLSVPEIDAPVQMLEETALLNRPELMEARYNERIGWLETRKAVARMLPGVEFSVGTHYDSNNFLMNDQWRDVGLRASWNLFNVLNYRNMKRSSELQYEIAQQQKLAMSMAVLTQTQVAYRDYLGRKRQFELAVELDSIDQKILGHTRNAARNDAQGKLQEVRASASALISELRRYQSYGALQGAYGQMLATLGIDEPAATLSAAYLEQLVLPQQPAQAPVSAGVQPVAQTQGP
jgi:outer membrane protein TolC